MSFTNWKIWFKSGHWGERIPKWVRDSRIEILHPYFGYQDDK